MPEAFGRISSLLRHEAADGVLPTLAAAKALALDNSPLGRLYNALLTAPVAVQVGALAHEAQKAVARPQTFARLVRCTLMHRRSILQLTDPPNPLSRDTRQISLQLTAQ